MGIMYSTGQGQQLDIVMGTGGAALFHLVKQQQMPEGRRTRGVWTFNAGISEAWQWS